MSPGSGVAPDCQHALLVWGKTSCRVQDEGVSSVGSPRWGAQTPALGSPLPTQHHPLWGGSFSLWPSGCFFFPVQESLPSYMLSSRCHLCHGQPPGRKILRSWGHTPLEPASWRPRAPGWTLWLLLPLLPPRPTYFSGLCFPPLRSQQLPTDSKTAHIHRAGFQEEVSLSWILEC